MIKFFRAIRERLLTEKRFSSYLLYAIGEIVLVVIGILLALQINNWNEDRKNTERENRYLFNINREILEDSLFLERGWFKNRSRKIQCLLNAREYVIGSYTPPDAKVFINNVGFGGIHSRFSMASSSRVYNELVSTGSLSLISNDSIRNMIVTFYTDKDFSQEYMDNLRTGYSTYVNSLKAYDPLHPDSINMAEIPRMLSKMKTDEFHSLINQELTYTYSNDRQLTRLNADASLLYGKIERYLKGQSK